MKTDISSKCEVALFFDEKGVPYDMYLADDFDDVAHKYKAITDVQPIKTALSDCCIKTCIEKGIPVRVICSEGISPETLREFCRENGVHIYCNKKAVVYSNNSFVFLHTCEDAEFDFTFDDKNTFTDVYTGKNLTFPMQLPLGRSFLFSR